MTADLPLSNQTHIDVLENGRERSVPVADLCRRLGGVDALIRLHPPDFDELPAEAAELVHFNLEVTLNQVGWRYALVPILRAGGRLPAGEEQLPLIDAGRFRTGTCLDVIQRLPLDRVTAAQLASSLPTIRTQGQLREALLRRYAPMFPGMSAADLIARGCAVTRLRLDPA